MDSQAYTREGRTKFTIYSLFAYPILPSIHSFLILNYSEREALTPSSSVCVHMNSLSVFPLPTPPLLSVISQHSLIFS